MHVSSLNCHTHWFTAAKTASLQVLCLIAFLAGKKLQYQPHQIRCGNGNFCPELDTRYVSHYGVVSNCWFLDLCHPCKLDTVNLCAFTLHYSLGYEDWHFSELELKCSCFAAVKWWITFHPVTKVKKGCACVCGSPIPCGGQTHVTYESIFNSLSTGSYSSDWACIYH